MMNGTAKSQSRSGVIDTTRKALSLLSSRERQHIKWLLLATVVMALIEAAGIASIMPFMTVVANRELIDTNRFLNGLYSTIGRGDPEFFQTVLGLLALTVLALANSFSAFATWLLMRFAFLSGHTLSERLLSSYLSRPYVFFLNRNSAELNKNVLAEVHRFVTGVLLPAIRMFSKTIVAATIVGLLLLVDAVLAIIVSVVLGSAYVAVYTLTRKKLSRIGKESVELAGLRFKTANEALGGVKDMKLLGCEQTFLARYSVSSRKFALVEASSEVISMLPRYAMETLAFGGIILIVLSLLGMKQGLGDVLPLVALYALAGYRLMPALQQIYTGMTKLRYHSGVIDTLHHDLRSPPIRAHEASIHCMDDHVDLREKIELRDVCFCYPGTSNRVLDHLSIAISANSTVGIVGATGSGKTTLIDIILGLLNPTEGNMYVDSTTVHGGNLRQWQENIGYVPQTIYLADDTITRNIAFGVPDNQIDRTAVDRAARTANLHDFIVSELPRGYETVVGERGVRLSGGQRQRIGIARALYHDPKVLVLDEATSALDGVTESVIMDAIHNLAHKKTIILVAHRLSTVRECDVVYILENGCIVGHGTYDRLLSVNEKFKLMANPT